MAKRTGNHVWRRTSVASLGCALIMLGAGLTQATQAYAAAGQVVNVAFGKPVTISDPSAITNGADPSIITDGDTARAHYVLVSVKNGAQYAQVDLRRQFAIERVTIWNDYNPDSPRKEQDVIIQLSNDPTFSQGVTTIFNNDQDNSAGQGAGHDQEYVNPTDGSGKTVDVEPAVTARYVRLWGNGHHLVSSGAYAPVNTPVEIKAFANPHDSVPPAAVNDLRVYGKSRTAVGLSWTAPGNDGNTGYARSYDFRYSTSPITEANFAQATQVENAPRPKVAGTEQTLTINNLAPGKTYYIAFQSEDEALNKSGLSNVVTVATPTKDTVAPAAVRDLTASQPDIHSVKLTWTAPGDNGNFARAARYDVRYSRHPITEANWNRATESQDELYQKPPGEQMVYQANELRTNATYYFAMKTIDQAGNVSGLSNVVRATTYVPTPDKVTVYSLDGLRAAIKSAPPTGRIITLAPKTYHQTQTINIKNKNNITIQGATSDFKDTVIQGIGENNKSTMEIGFKLFSSDYITFKNLTIEDDYYHSIQLKPGSTYFHADHIKTWNDGESGFKVTSPARYDLGQSYNDYGKIEDCLIGNDVGGYRGVVEGIDMVAVKGWVIRGNMIENIKHVNGFGGYAVYPKGNSIGTIIEGNVVHDSDIGISFGDGGTGRQYFRNNDPTYEHRGGIVRNNIVYNIEDTGIFMSKAHNFRVYNNTLVNVGQDTAGAIGSRYSTSSGQIRSNLILAPNANPKIKKRDGGHAILSNNITDATLDMFVNPSAGNYHLKSTATRAIDQVKLFSHTARFDFDTQIRPYGKGWDIGADEYEP